jgi:hypothetical protein
MPDPASSDLDIRLVAEIVADRNSGWACDVVDGSASILGTGTRSRSMARSTIIDSRPQCSPSAEGRT